MYLFDTNAVGGVGGVELGVGGVSPLWEDAGGGGRGGGRGGLLWGPPSFLGVIFQVGFLRFALV